jgi:CRP-like cAMP-binding protein
VLLDQLPHQRRFVIRKLFGFEAVEEDILLLAVMTPVGVCANFSRVDNCDLELLTRCRLFEATPASQLRTRLERLPHGVNDYEAGAFIRSQADHYDELLILLQGQVAGELRTYDGRLMRVETLSAPETVASAFLFSPQGRLPVDIVAVQPTRIFRLPRSAVLSLARECPGVLERLLADIFGSARQSLFRCLGELEEKGFITQHGRSVHILDPDALRRHSASSDVDGTAAPRRRSRSRAASMSRSFANSSAASLIRMLYWPHVRLSSLAESP